LITLKIRHKTTYRFRTAVSPAELYVPGAGWITFDPTNRSVGGFNLIPGRRRARHSAGDARIWQFRRDGRRLRGNVGRGSRHIVIHGSQREITLHRSDSAAGVSLDS
jgi:hypothetical protein